MTTPNEKQYRAAPQYGGYGFTAPDPTFGRLATLEFAVEALGDDDTDRITIVLDPAIWEFLVFNFAKAHARKTFGL